MIFLIIASQLSDIWIQVKINALDMILTHALVRLFELSNCFQLSTLGFRTGIPRVQFSHTVPTPAETVPVPGAGTYRTVFCAVLYETRGIPLTCLFFSFKICIFSFKLYRLLTEIKRL